MELTLSTWAPLGNLLPDCNCEQVLGRYEHPLGMRVWVQPAGEPPIPVGKKKKEKPVEVKTNLEWIVEEKRASFDSKINCRDGTRVSKFFYGDHGEAAL